MMNQIYKLTTTLLGAVLLLGCAPIENPKPSISTPTIITPHIGNTPIKTTEYGYPPEQYRIKIKNYFSNKLKRGYSSHYTFSKPQRAFKRKGLAYGGKVSWRGWLVDVAVTTRSRTGRVRSPKPYMVLFKGSVIVEDILGTKHKLLTRVGR